jgi:GNAT superfamily N-acetyltransferase
MSFWNSSPGPTWIQCIDTLNPCIQAPYGICKRELIERPKDSTLPRGLSFIVLSAKSADEMETFLRQHFTIFTGSRISLSKGRIQRGFFLDDWIGIGVKTMDNLLVGCCISKPLGALKFPNEIYHHGGVVDYFCVHSSYRKQGIAEAMLKELVQWTARRGRLVHFFLKEGFPLVKIPPIWYSHYIARRKRPMDSLVEYLGKESISTHTTIKSYTHADFLPLRHFVANLPYQLSEDSELFSFNYKGHCVTLCLTDLHHVTVPTGLKLGELLWIVPGSAEVPLHIQKLAVETLVDYCKYDIILMDTTIPHDPRKGWWKDASYSWYCFNYNPGGFFRMKPYFIF